MAEFREYYRLLAQTAQARDHERGPGLGLVRGEARPLEGGPRWAGHDMDGRDGEGPVDLRLCGAGLSTCSCIRVNQW